MTLEDIHAITPVNFFEISADCAYLPIKKGFSGLNRKNSSSYLLPITSSLCREETFAELAIGWNELGLEFYIEVEKEFQECSYPDVSQGDSIELFIDTRDVKTSGFNTRFCHHFFFLPAPINGCQKGEITHFRSEDAHELCDSEELNLKVEFGKSFYSLNCFIPKECLHGYEPEQFSRIGFSYRINRHKAPPQHFSVVTEDYVLEQQPSLWSSLKLVQ